jgi:D-alanyl-D-alanine carboxypeptidase/D-alanyl-D-alanine-endopeptidase (penicillin-binding protein 4)
MRRAKRPHLSLAAACIFLLSSCSSLYRSQSDEAALLSLKKSIDGILADSIFVPAHVGIKVVSLVGGRVLCERGSRALFHPGSNLKLLTAATALHALGKDYEFKTVLCTDSIIESGVLLGNLCIKGFGNPDLSSKDLRWMVEQLKAMGVRRVKGDLIGDVSFFDSLFWGKGWMWDDEPSPSEAFITPLSVNDNSVKVYVKTGQRVGDPVQVRLEPETRCLQLENNGLTGPDTVTNTIEVTRKCRERLNTIVVNGTLPIDSLEHGFALSVWQPELYALSLLREDLEREGIAVEGTSRLGTLRNGSTRLVLHKWPIDSVVINMMKMSDNLSAENTLKVVAAEKRGPPGTASNGISIVNGFLFSLGIDTTAYLMVDGSGVSHYNLIDAQTIVDLLCGMQRQEELIGLFRTSLPIAGVDGTLEKRMRGTSAEGRVRAKTGTLRDASSLSGYVQAEGGDALAFSILMQDFIGSPKPYRDAQDKIVELLARFQPRTISGLR